MDVRRADARGVPRLRAAARDARALHPRRGGDRGAGGLPVWRPHALVDPGDDAGWAVADAFGFGPSLWVAPVLEDGARSREVRLPRGEWIEAWSGERVAGGGVVEAPAPLHATPLWVRTGALVVTYPAEHVARGLGDTPEAERPLVATLWGEPRCGRALARLADGTRIAWRRGRWSVPGGRDVACQVIGAGAR